MLNVGTEFDNSFNDRDAVMIHLNTDMHKQVVMKKVTTLNLVDVSWPISILKCSNRVEGMRPGEHMVVTMKDSDTRDSIVGLLKTLPAYDFTVRRAGKCLLLNVFRRPDAFNGK